MSKEGLIQVLKGIEQEIAIIQLGECMHCLPKEEKRELAGELGRLKTKRTVIQTQLLVYSIEGIYLWPEE